MIFLKFVLSCLQPQTMALLCTNYYPLINKLHGSSHRGQGGQIHQIKCFSSLLILTGLVYGSFYTGFFLIQNLGIGCLGATLLGVICGKGRRAG